MAPVQKYQTQREEALAQVLDVLRERVKRCGECQVTTTSLRIIIAKHLGVSSSFAKFLREFVLGYLVAKDILIFWDETTRNQGRLLTYQVNTFALNNT